MKLFRGYFLYALVSFASATVAFSERVVDHVTERIIEPMLDIIASLFAPASPRLAADGPALDRSIDQPSLSASLLESLRHEKGVPRFGAARNT